MKKHITAMALAGLVATAAPGIASATDLTASSWFPPSHIMSTALYDYFAERANEYGKGSLNVTADTGSALITPRGSLESLSDGLTDIALHMGPYTPSQLPVSNSLEEMALTFADVPPTALISAITAFSLSEPMLQAEWAKNGIVFGGPFITPPYGLACNKPVTTVADLKGLRLRAPNRAIAEWAREFGAVPVSLSSNEQYSALDKGALDCTAAALQDVVQRKLFEVTSDATDIPLAVFWSGFGWAYNAKVWAGLDEAQRRALFNAHGDALAHFTFDGVIEAIATSSKELPGLGVKVHAPAADLVEKTNALRSKIAAAAPQVASKEFGVADAEALFERFHAAVDEWKAKVEAADIKTEEEFATFLKEQVYGKIDVSSYGGS